MNNQNSYFYWADNTEKADDLKNLNDLFYNVPTKTNHLIQHSY